MQLTRYATIALCSILMLGASMTESHADKDKSGKARHEDSKREQREIHEYQKQKQKDEHEYRKSEQKAEREYDKAERKAAKFESRHRDAVATYYRSHYGGGRGCPPGMRRHGDHCEHPDQRRYSVGHSLATSISLVPLPQALIVSMTPPPPGFAYAFVDGDVVLYEVPTRVVVDVVVAPF